MFDNRTTTYTGANTAAYDAGLRTHFQKVYSLIAWGLAITGATAYGVSSVPALMQLLFGTPLKWVLIFAPMAFVWFGFSPSAIMRKSPAQLQTLFYGFSAVFGASLSTIFVVFQAGDIARAFFVTSATFAAMSLWGYTTKRDLSGMASFVSMALIGLIIAMVVNLFLKSSMMDFVISCMGVLVYTVLTATHTQMIKESYSATYGSEANAKSALMGALSLYIAFIGLFQFILSLMGGNRD